MSLSLNPSSLLLHFNGVEICKRLHCSCNNVTTYRLISHSAASSRSPVLFEQHARLRLQIVGHENLCSFQISDPGPVSEYHPTMNALVRLKSIKYFFFYSYNNALQHAVMKSKRLRGDVLSFLAINFASTIEKADDSILPAVRSSF